MKNILIIAITLFSLLKCANAQVIVNSGFETWDPGCPVNTAPVGWINFSTGLGPDQAGNCAGTVVSYEDTSHMNLVWWTGSGLFEGTQQSVSGFVSGQTYTLSFYAINDQGLYSYGDPVVLDVYLEGVVIYSTTEMVNGGLWTHFTVDFMATAATQLIGFRVNLGSSGTSGSVGVDAVSLNVKTGLEDLPASELFIQPNPFTSSATIIFNQPGNFDFMLYNLFGQQVRRAENISNQYTLERGNLPAGVYFYKVEEEGKMIGGGKIIVE